jgi:tRNA (cmo5U34)-methyltransferase
MAWKKAWKRGGKLEHFISTADLVVPRRREQIEFILQLIPHERKKPIRALDLGAGQGTLTEAILQTFPNGRVVWLDGSADMMKIAKKRLGKYRNRISLVLGELDNPSWLKSLEVKFDVVVSSLAIHHLSDQRKRALFREIWSITKEKGAVIIADLVKAESRLLEKKYEQLWLETIRRQAKEIAGIERTYEEVEAKHLEMQTGEDRPATLGAQLKWLRQAGFVGVDCFWKYACFVIFAGFKRR